MRHPCQAPTHSSQPGPPSSATPSAACALVALVLVELRTAAPIVDVRTFRHGPLVLISVLTVAVGFGSAAAAPVVAALLAASVADAATGYAIVFWVAVGASAVGAAASVALVARARRRTA